MAAVLATALAFPLFASGADAAGCPYTSFKQYGKNGYARTTDANGQCSKVGARAGFSVSGTTSTIWTSRTYGGDVAQTPTVSNLVASDHSGE
ncbi:hypothetical protein [Cellulomonas iranensis]|uniref:Uncharacterized protein n=1 Tax=Cellulomonas iranensis TaxID=76862 RepID=A0ABU0GHR4_9CELL|nr:hypothetical protein [Cellulomonas iranensis]MDQ0424132.1 hypothetical protein [Cellulomonas iranensis]